MTRLLVVTAVPVEAAAIRAGLEATSTGLDAVRAGLDAVRAGLDAVRAGLEATSAGAVTVAPVGVGPGAAGAATARLLALAEATGKPYRAVLSAGIGGGFTGRVEVGDTVLASRSIAADLGAESPGGFIPLDELGMPLDQLGGGIRVDADRMVLDALRQALPTATVGTVLTVSTVTGTATSARVLADRHPDAVAEAMEGYAVGVAAGQAGVPFAELRTISNPIGPRDRGTWRMREAFAALTSAGNAIGSTSW